MLSSIINSLIGTLDLNTRRNFTTTTVRFEVDGRLKGDTHRVNNFEKRLLVWTKKYKSIEEIPAYVTPESVERARSRMRIRVANIMMVLTLVGCVAMIYTGKKAHERGESVQQYNLDSHQKYNEEQKLKEKPQI